MKKRVKSLLPVLIIILAFVLLIFFVNFVSASFSLGEPSHDIETVYQPKETIKGWIYISFNNEPTLSSLKSSLGGSINLIDLLNKASNSKFVKTCNTINCVSGYVSSNPETSKVLDLNENQYALFGFNITDKMLLTSITKFRFNVTSNNPETAEFPLAIDILSDGIYEWNAYSSSDTFGSEKRGCFEIPTEQVNIAYSTWYCERIALQRAPQLEIGAYAYGSIPGITFSMKIRSFDGSSQGGCTTGASDGTGTVIPERLSCLVPSFSVGKADNYFVCIKASSSSNSDKYKINIDDVGELCGFSNPSGTFDGSYNHNFEIFARPKFYAAGIKFTLDDAELVKINSPVKDTEKEIKDYITLVYGNNCSKGCIIPVKAFSGVNQILTLSDAYISYVTDISTATDKFYDITESPALMSSGYQKLYLNESGFIAPSENGAYVLSITLNTSGTEHDLFSEEISVIGGEEPVPESSAIKSLRPLTTGKKVPTLFQVTLNGTIKVAKYGWSFGDGEIKNTTTREVSHTYNTVGSYKMKVTLFSSSGIISSREFNVTVSPASEILPSLLEEAETKLDLVKEQSKSSNFSSFEQKAINYSLKLSQTETSLARLRTSLSQANSDDDYEKILGELLALNIPFSIATTTSASGIGFYPSENNINPEMLKEVGGGNYTADKEEQYKKAILAWYGENINSILFYKEISGVYEDSQEPLLRTFDISIAKSGEGKVYILLRDMENILFKEDYSQKKKEGYYYIEMSNPDQRLVFSTTEDVNFFSLPMFTSPPIDELVLEEGWSLYTPEGQLKKWVIFSIVIFFVLLVVAALWIVLQFWYKRKYEGYLFKNRNNLYNLVNYIQNEKNRGIGEREIVSKLKKVGWASEQIKYALKKHAGKRTGMPEIPVEKLFKGRSAKRI